MTPLTTLTPSAQIVRALLGSGNVIPLHRETVKMINRSGAKSAYETTALLEQIAYWHSKMIDSEWFYNTREEWMDQLAFSERQLKNAIAHLKSIGLLSTKRKLTAYQGGVANLLYFRLDFNRLAEYMQGAEIVHVAPASEEPDDGDEGGGSGQGGRFGANTASVSRLYKASVSIDSRLQQEITSVETDSAPSAAGIQLSQKIASAIEAKRLLGSSTSAKSGKGGQVAKASKQTPSSPDAAAPPSSPKVKGETPAQMLIFGLAKPWVMRGSSSEEGLSEVAFTRMRSSIGKVASELTGVGVTTEAGFQEFLGYMLDRHFHGLHREGEKINFGTWKNAADGYVQWAADGKKAAPSSAGSGKNDKVTAQLKAARAKQATAIVAEVNSDRVVVEGDDGVLKW